MDMRAWHIISSLGMGIKPKEEGLLSACRHVAIITMAFMDPKHEANISLMDSETKTRLYIKHIDEAWKKEGMEAPTRSPSVQHMVDYLEAQFALNKSLEISIPCMGSLKVCVDTYYLKMERCQGCETAYRSVVNAYQCEASHAARGKTQSTIPLDVCKVAQYWDTLSQEDRRVLLDDGDIDVNSFIGASGQKIVELIDAACESTHLLYLLREPKSVSNKMMTNFDYVAKKIHAFTDRMIKAYTASQERQLLELLEAEEAQKIRKKEKKYDKHLKRLENKIFHRSSTLVTTAFWWEDE